MRWFIVFSFVLLSLIAPPPYFPTNQPVEITPGEPVANALKRQGVINSELLFSNSARLFGLDKNLKSGRYLFAKPLPWPMVLWRVSHGDYGTISRKVTIPEGWTNAQISQFLGLAMGGQDQGYLFPDTYFFDQFATADEIRTRMKQNFLAKAGNVSVDSVILASLVEAEAAGTSDRRLVAGILQKRLAAGMPLQLDAASSTYEYAGLPSAPINNPGLDSLNAARYPLASPYWYYISDRAGAIHYARSFAEHKANRERYGI